MVVNTLYTLINLSYEKDFPAPPVSVVVRVLKKAAGGRL